MTGRPWPLGADKRPRSRAALRSAEVDVVREWLHLSVRSWTNAENDGERAAAFTPLALAAIEPARQVGQWADGLSAEARLRVEQAMAEALDAWRPGPDAAATILLVEIAAFVGGRGVGTALLGLLGKPVYGGERERRDLAEAIAFYGQQHAPGREARYLAYRLREAGLRVPTAAMILLACAAKEFGADIIGDLEIAAPEVMTSDPSADPRIVAALRQFCANILVDTIGAPAAIELALHAQQRGMPELREAISRFRLAVSADGPTHFLLRDRLTSLTSRADVSAVPREVRETPASVAVNDNLISSTSIDGYLAAGRRQ